jgi:ABC-type Fe3+/spermidine/putrescine transport system ATPase subunit
MNGGIRLEGAQKRFGAVQALAGVDLRVKPGEFVVLLGPSGSGKTTLLRALAGLEPLDAGRIYLGETLVEDANTRLRLPPEARGLGMVFQEYALWPHLSALENISLPLRERKIPEWKARAQDALENVGLTAKAARFPYELSGGQQQRVALARALAARPEVLLFDEPLSNLDAQLRDELRLEIARLTRAHGITAVYITHDQSEAFFLADRLGVMCNGQLVQFDLPENIYAAPATRFVAQFTGALGNLEATVRGSSLSCGSISLELPGSQHAQGTVRLALRPEAIKVHRTAQSQSLEVTLLHCAYSGGHYQCWLELPGGERLLAHSDERLPNLERVWVTFDPTRLLIFPASETMVPA